MSTEIKKEEEVSLTYKETTKNIKDKNKNTKNQQ